MQFTSPTSGISTACAAAGAKAARTAGAAISGAGLGAMKVQLRLARPQ